MAFWEQVAEHYQDAPASVVFEILNEPNGEVIRDPFESSVKYTSRHFGSTPLGRNRRRGECPARSSSGYQAVIQ
jgi:hypothetical protein